MKLKQAIKQSEYDTASHVEHGYGYYVDGSIGDGFDVAYGVQGLPVHPQGHYETLDKAIATLPAEIASSDKWEPMGEEI